MFFVLVMLPLLLVIAACLDILPYASRTSVDHFRKSITTETVRTVFGNNKAKLR